MRPRRHIRRILVALDASPHSLAALEAAAELAAALHAELAGLFVEDESLLRLPHYPFAREHGRYAQEPRPLLPEQMERQLRAQAGIARQAVSNMAGRAGVTWSFRVVRGSVAKEVLAAATEADLITMGRMGWSITQQRPLGSTAQAVLANTPGLALVLAQGICLGLPMLCLYDGSPASQEALNIAADLLRMRPNGKLTVWIMATDPHQAHELYREADAALGDELEIRYRTVRATTPAGLARYMLTEPCGLLVLPAESPLIQDGALFGLLKEYGCPVLVVR